MKIKKQIMQNNYFLKKSLFLLLLTSFFISITGCTSFAQESDRLQAIYLTEYTSEYLGGVAKKIVIDKNNKEVLALKSDGSLAILDEDGMLLFNMSLKKIFKFCVNKVGDIFISEGANKLIVLNYRGEFKRKVDLSSVPEYESILVQSLHMSEDGFLFIGDGKNKRIVVLDPDEKFFLQFGEAGYGKGMFMNIAAIATNSERIYSLDPALFRVSVFDRAGKFQFIFGQISSLLGGFSMPIELDADEEYIYVLDANRAMVIVFDLTGSAVIEFGGIGKNSDKFDWPSDIKVDGRGKAYVADIGNRKLKVFRVIKPPDTDGDGVVDFKDSCPAEKGIPENKGCPAPDMKVPPNEKK